MAARSRTLRCWAQRRRTALRLLLVVAAIALLIDGFCVERNVLHLMLLHPLHPLHPLHLLALLGALVSTEEPDPPGPSDER